MTMLEGEVVINSLTGAVTTKTGAAGAVFNVLDGGTDYGTLSVTNAVAYAAAREQIAVQARAIAALIPYIKTNAVVSTTVSTTVATTGTASAQTGTGTGSGSGTVA